MEAPSEAWETNLSFSLYGTNACRTQFEIPTASLIIQLYKAMKMLDYF
jgi:hypothetical protein